MWNSFEQWFNHLATGWQLLVCLGLLGWFWKIFDLLCNISNYYGQKARFLEAENRAIEKDFKHEEPKTARSLLTRLVANPDFQFNLDSSDVEITGTRDFVTKMMSTLNLDWNSPHVKIVFTDSLDDSNVKVSPRAVELATDDPKFHASAKSVVINPLPACEVIPHGESTSDGPSSLCEILDVGGEG